MILIQRGAEKVQVLSPLDLLSSGLGFGWFSRALGGISLRQLVHT